MRLRSQRHWDKEAFERLTEAMRLCCKHYEISSQEQERRREEVLQMSDEELEAKSLFPPAEPTRLLPDWLATLFWFVPRFVQNWTSHKFWDQARAREPEYFQKAYRRLDALASWYFNGYSPWKDEEWGWSSTFVDQ